MVDKVLLLLQKYYKNKDLSNLDILEIGPKDGQHTMFFHKNNVKSLTCVELPNKKETHNVRWVKKMKNNFEIVYEDFLRYKTDKKFDILLCSGVIYHNIEQVRILKKLHSLAKDNATLVFETVTARRPHLNKENIIEVHYPNTYRDTKTIIFIPSLSAAEAMLDISGWDIVQPISKDERYAAYCKKKTTCLETYPDINHELIED